MICSEFRKKYELEHVNCCLSCHEDEEEYGYDLCCVEADGQDHIICCALAVAFRER